MKKIALAALFCTVFHPAVAATVSLTENFDDLNGWTPASHGSYAHVIADPTGGSGNVLAFASGNSAGDIFSLGTFTSGYINFDYFGAAALGSSGGGFVGISAGLPGTHQWLAGSSPHNGTPMSLVNNGTWNHYSIAFNAANVGAGAAHLMLEQFSTNIPNQAYFRNLTVSDTPLAAVPEPETYAMLLAGLGLIGFSLRRRQAAAR
ncbi:PEP-CTERM sorting domain-containing protein [Janthinobacterium agaricidamnosum]|uniref:PEP-CTERM putative exosortase interaction domain protein n=1 Tax=Janthinobacterium agaricidamnosum NBRC 102515 = DSM 9628 TaxID=1349767 RepID=W0VDK9_9BURK|nr:PEP-CTERM sorting domain-containing protein [Janthinobacterium agaricidamnosum]CDG85453.1 PEP-CTERM putative exosortase interaction domain protein [Janthinobacterium agaricidamnosum NBRC 102515 = DSM 9628]